jgi:hypothetical protein
MIFEHSSKKRKALFFISLSLLLSGIFLFIVQNNKSSKDDNLPLGYTLDKYTIEKTLENSCQVDTDCQTPGEYLIQSRCPFTTLCLENRCTVVCPSSQ